MSIETALRAAIQGCAGKEDVLMKLVRNERYYVLPWDACDFWTWLYWKWERKFGMGSPGLNRLEKGFRLFGFTHIREWLVPTLTAPVR